MPLSKLMNRERMRQIRLHNPELKDPVQPKIPMYNPTFHRAGDTVRMIRGNKTVVVTIPELDADGQPIY